MLRKLLLKFKMSIKANTVCLQFFEYKVFPIFGTVFRVSTSHKFFQSLSTLFNLKTSRDGFEKIWDHSRKIFLNRLRRVYKHGLPNTFLNMNYFERNICRKSIYGRKFLYIENKSIINFQKVLTEFSFKIFWIGKVIQNLLLLQTVHSELIYII